jgi:hypothetical protein
MDKKKWENYNGLPSDQEEDLYELFISYMNENRLGCYEDAELFFKSGTDTFTFFILALEEQTTWFDYTQMPQIFDEISLYLEQLSEDFSLDGDDEEDEWD